jgi:hypothetical protein
MVIIITRTALSTLPFVYFKMFPWSKQWPSTATRLQQIHGVANDYVVPKVPGQQEDKWQNHPSMDSYWQGLQKNKRCGIEQQVGDGTHKHPVGGDKPSDADEMVCNSKQTM